MAKRVMHCACYDNLGRYMSFEQGVSLSLELCVSKRIPIDRTGASDRLPTLTILAPRVWGLIREQNDLELYS